MYTAGVGCNMFLKKIIGVHFVGIIFTLKMSKIICLNIWYESGIIYSL